jgi:uncharacterized protein (DUF952 family)
MALIYKLLKRETWQAAVAQGVFAGAGIDLADGYIHLSTAAQVRETARRYFTEGDDIMLVAWEDTGLAGLVHEPSRGGDLFPHVYGTLDPAAAGLVLALKRQPDGLLHFPDEIG